MSDVKPPEATPPSDLLPLIERLLNGDLDDAGFARLDEILRDNAQARRVYRRYINLHDALPDLASEGPKLALRHPGQDDEAEQAGETPHEMANAKFIRLLLEVEASGKEVVVVDADERDKSDKPNGKHADKQDDPGTLSAHDLAAVGGYLLRKAALSKPALYAYAAAVAIVALVLINPWGGANDPITNPPTAQQDPQQQPKQVATLTATHNAAWAGAASAAPANGSPLYPNQRLTLTEGFAQITTHRGAIAIIQAPATIELINNNALRLHAGKLVGICQTQSSKQFLVRTPHMDITDLGTEFGVEVTDQQAAVTVFTGKIELTAPGGEPQQLSADQTARLVVDGNNRDLVIHNRVATGFDALRMIPDTYSVRLPGTGEGLELNTHDPNWRITAIDGRALDNPLPLRVSAYTAGDPDPLMPSAMLAYNPTHGQADTIYRVETSLHLPDGLVPEDTQLIVRFRMDNELMSMQVNGQDVPVPEQSTTVYGRDYAMVIQGPLRPGDNHIAFEVENEGLNTQQNPVGIQVRWELQPVPAEAQNEPALD